MKKKLITAAVGAALVAVAGIAQAEVKVSGYANVSLDSIKGCENATCVDNSNNLNISSNSSYIKFDAVEDIGGGLKGVFSATEFVQIDENASGLLTGGNTYAGIAGDFGVVVMGTHDTGGKLVGRTFDLFGNQIGDSRNMAVDPLRVNNLIAYLSPNFSGFSFVVGYTTNPLETTATNDDSASAYSAMLSYANGPLAVAVGYDAVSLGDTASSDPTLDGMKIMNVGAKYAFPSGTEPVVFYQKINNAAEVKDYDFTTIGVGVKQSFGNEVVKAQYYQLETDDSSDKCKATMVAVGYDHNFSKAATGYVAYAQTTNDDDAACVTRGDDAFSMAGSGHGDDPGTASGEKMSGLSVGFILKF